MHFILYFFLWKIPIPLHDWLAPSHSQSCFTHLISEHALSFAHSGALHMPNELPRLLALTLFGLVNLLGVCKALKHSCIIVVISQEHVIAEI